eukprot:GFUD01016568.1.p1 GENE.GFUD01016568.1~~GFUD01016568.1.p1  ORF type:complete len:1245 (+),score=319.51 GFUD01016568.1:47-3781(+)
MWSEWSTLPVHPHEASSVLDKLPPAESRKVVLSVVSSLPSSSSPLETEQEVSWCLDVLRHGLQIDPCDSLTQDCVNMYCQWLSVLLPMPASNVPIPIFQDANHIARKMLDQLYQLFKKVDYDQLDESDSSSLLVTLCVQVLRLLEKIGQQSAVMERQTWHSLLSLLLSVSDLILGQPGPGGHLCYTVVAVLVHTWLAACARCFPEPTMWKTFITMCSGWRHRMELVSHWSKVNLTLLAKQLQFMYGPQFPALTQDTCCSNLHLEMSPECVAQTSFRFLHLLGNLAELSQPKLVSSSQPFLQAALVSPDVIEPQSHPCLDILPDIFLQAMRGLFKMVQAYLGFDRSAAPIQFSPLRPRCNSILHLFGPWLFQAALFGTKFDGFSSTTSDFDEKYGGGRAEALGALCLIFSSKKLCEEIETPYLARFFLAVQLGLKAGPLLSSSVLRYSGSLMALDLPGANVLTPHLVTALKSVLQEENTDHSVTNMAPTYIRQCSIEVAKTVSVLPTHFAGMTTLQLLEDDASPVPVALLRGEMFNFLLSSLQNEKEPENCQQLLATLSFVVELQAVIEEADDNSSRNKTDLKDDDSATNWITELLRLVCHRLISSWSTDYPTSLSALELLTGLATSSAEQEGMECKRALRWICDFIVLQCNRPPPAHSRDLHSSIIAAFQACLTWLAHRPSLLEDRECLLSVLEVAELAISGSKSQVKSSDTPILKEDKVLSPVSKRVRCAAEDVLSAVMHKVGYVPGSSVAEKVSTQLTEESLLVKLGSDSIDPTEEFKYFLCDKSYILAISREYVANEDISAPTAMLLIRGASGKTAWMLQLRNTKLGEAVVKKDPPSRPVGHPKRKPENSTSVPPSNFPAVEVKEKCAADTVIPTLNQDSEEFDPWSLDNIICEQVKSEESIINATETNDPEKKSCTEPEPSGTFQTARLVLSQLGLLSIPRLVDEESSLIELKTSSPGFWEDLKSLDGLNTRTYDTVLVYYVKTGQTSATDILANSLSANLPQDYLNLLSSLGWQVEVAEHSGWTGNTKTSWNVPSSGQHSSEPARSDNSHVLYWSDEFSELAILVPCETYLWHETGLESDVMADQISICSNMDSPGLGRRLPSRKERVSDDQRVVVAWMENMEDVLKFPLSQLVPGYNSVCLVIFLQPLASGLVRVKLAGFNGKPKCVVPLVDGLVVSPLVVGKMVRQTALNSSRRARLETDRYHHTPSTRRRSAVQLFGEKFGTKDLEISKMFESLFN